MCIEKNYPVTVNDPALTEAMLPTLQRVAGADIVQFIPKAHRHAAHPHRADPAARGRETAKALRWIA